MSSPEAAVAEAVSASTPRFSVHACPEPGVMPRVLELFAKRGLVPDRFASRIVRPGMSLTIDVEIAGLDREVVEYVASCMRQIAGVELVLTA